MYYKSCLLSLISSACHLQLKKKKKNNYYNNHVKKKKKNLEKLVKYLETQYFDNPTDFCAELSKSRDIYDNQLTLYGMNNKFTIFRILINLLILAI